MIEKENRPNDTNNPPSQTAQIQQNIRAENKLNVDQI